MEQVKENQAKELIREVIYHINTAKSNSNMPDLEIKSEEDIYELFRFLYFREIEEYPPLSFPFLYGRLYKNITPINTNDDVLEIILPRVSDIFIYQIFEKNGKFFKHDRHGEVFNMNERSVGAMKALEKFGVKIILENIDEEHTLLRIENYSEEIALDIVTPKGRYYLIPQRHINVMEERFKKLWENYISPYKEIIQTIAKEIHNPYKGLIKELVKEFILNGKNPSYENFVKAFAFALYGIDEENDVFVDREELPQKIKIEIDKKKTSEDLRIWWEGENNNGDFIDLYFDYPRHYFKVIENDLIEVAVRIRKKSDKFIVSLKMFNIGEDFKNLNLYFGSILKKEKTLQIWNARYKNIHFLEEKLNAELKEKSQDLNKLYGLFKAFYELKKDDKFEVRIHLPSYVASKIVYNRGEITGYFYAYYGMFLSDNVEGELERVDKILKVRDCSYKDTYADLISSSDCIEVDVIQDGTMKTKRYYSNFEYGIQYGGSFSETPYRGCYEKYHSLEEFKKRMEEIKPLKELKFEIENVKPLEQEQQERKEKEKGNIRQRRRRRKRLK